MNSSLNPNNPNWENAVDWALGLEYVGDNEALYERMLRKFVDSYAGMPAQITAALDCADYGTAQRTAHTLKGTCATLGMQLLSSAAARLEDLLKERAPNDAIRMQIATLISHHNATIAAIQQRYG